QRFQYRPEPSRGEESDPRRARSRSSEHGPDGLLAPERLARGSDHQTDTAASRCRFLLQLRNRSDGRRAEICPGRDRTKTRSLARERISWAQSGFALLAGLRKFY